MNRYLKKEIRLLQEKIYEQFYEMAENTKMGPEMDIWREILPKVEETKKYFI